MNETINKSTVIKKDITFCVPGYAQKCKWKWLSVHTYNYIHLRECDWQKKKYDS